MLVAFGLFYFINAVHPVLSLWWKCQLISHYSFEICTFFVHTCLYCCHVFWKLLVKEPQCIKHGQLFMTFRYYVGLSCFFPLLLFIIFCTVSYLMFMTVTFDANRISPTKEPTLFLKYLKTSKRFSSFISCRDGGHCPAVWFVISLLHFISILLGAN